MRKISTESVFENTEIVGKIVSMGKALHLEPNEKDVEDLVEEHANNLTAKKNY